MKFRLVVVITALMLCLMCLPALAAVADLVKADFATVRGYVVMSSGDDYIVDLDAVQGVAAGDLFSVVEKGEKIVHPISGKILGTLEKNIAVLQISRVNSGYSYARAISGDKDKIAVGGKVQRYGNLSAVFRDEVGGYEALYADLKTALPALQWQDSASARVAELFFVVTSVGLQVRDQQGTLLRAYAMDAVAPLTSQLEADSHVVHAAPAAVDLPVVPLVTADTVIYEAPVATPSAAGSGLNMEFPRFHKIGKFELTTVMADFETLAGRQLMAATDGGRIQVYCVNESLELVANGDSTTPGQILALSWYQPQVGQQPYLAVTVWSDDQINADLLRLQGDRLVPVIDGYPTMLAGFDINDDGVSELLLGQEFNRETFYGRRVSNLTLTTQGLQSAKTTFELPSTFQLFGALLSDVTGDSQIETIFLRNHRLYIYSGLRQLYKSSKELGASISSVTYDVDPDAQNPMINSASCEVAPIAADLDGDGICEIIAIAAEGNILKSVGSAAAIDKSWLSVFKYRNGMVMKGTLGDKLERPLQGLSVQGDRVLMVATEVGGLLDSNEASYLLAVPVQ